MPESTRPRSEAEDVKEASRFLRGSLREELAADTPSFSGGNPNLLKFHGIYQQDDRDVRRDRTAKGLGPDHIFMVRASVPGGVLTAEQWLAMDRLADEVANGALRITTRQGVQFHFVRKGGLQPLLHTLNEHLVTTLAACGDVVRNVMCCPAPLTDRSQAEIQAYARMINQRLKPRTRAYYELWVDGERAVTASEPESEPLYGATYLPRKFKVAIAFPGDNCVDAHTQDLAAVPVLDEVGRLRAFTVLVGGGLGRSHTDDTTFPRLGEPLATVEPEDLLPVIETVIATWRDHGNRADRAHARIKYLIHEWGLPRFRQEVEGRLGRALPDPEPVVWRAMDDHLGWHRQADGAWYLGVPVPSGRVLDGDEGRMRSGLRAVVERFRPGVRLTPNQDVLLTDLGEHQRAEVEAVLREHGVTLVEELPEVVRNAAACPALPTCGLALTDAERVAGEVLAGLRTELDAAGLADVAPSVRMTGCPNGCARPYTAEIGVVGRGKGKYDLHLGGNTTGTRLNTVFAENVKLADFSEALRPVLAHYRDERQDHEGLGDFADRVGVDELRKRYAPEPARRPRRRAEVPVGAD